MDTLSRRPHHSHQLVIQALLVDIGMVPRQILVWSHGVVALSTPDEISIILHSIDDDN